MAKWIWTSLLLLAGSGAVLPVAPQRPAVDTLTGAHCLLLYAQSEELPAPGNPGHERPAEGARCVHNEQDAAHNCSCHRECKQNTDEDGNPAQGAHVQEDPKCRVYCFKDHCHCPVDNCE
jgi:hypothetical protein